MAMADGPEFLRRAVVKTVKTGDRHGLARVMVNSMHVRHFVYLLARHDDPDGARMPDRATLDLILRRAVNRLRDVHDPALGRLGQAEDADGFQHALGEFLRTTVGQVLKPTARPALAPGIAAEIAGVLMAAGLDGDVIRHLAQIRISASECLAAR